jgi:outer membrane immunogenic protein
MKKFVFALTLVSALVQPFVSASAADFEPPPPTDDLRPATYDWSGVYVGASVGGTCFDGSADITGTVTHMKDCGTLGSGFAGYNMQVDHLVFGMEAELGYMKNEGKYGDATLGSQTIGRDMFGGIKGRMGYAMDNTLIYGLAGYSMARGEYGEIIVAPPPGTETSQNNWHHGWSVGMGVEHAITDVIRVRGEYAFTKYAGNDDYISNCAGCPVDVDFGNVHTFSLGVSYAF